MSSALSIVFAGTPAFAATILQALLEDKHRIICVYTQPDRPAGRGRKVRPGPVKTLATEAGLPVRQPERFGKAECAHLAGLRADVMLVIAYGLLLPHAALEAPRLGCINIHTSLLPRWRGAAPIQRALLAGDTKTGISFMQMVEALDAGPVLHQVSTEMRPGDTTAQLRQRLAQSAASEMSGVLDRLAGGEITPKAQEVSRILYAPKVDKCEALIDWSESAVQIERKVRAFNDWPVAYSHLEKQRVRIWEAHPLMRSADEPPGAVLEARKGIEVATGEGVLDINRLQMPGGKPLSAHDFVNAHDLRGLRFSC